MRRTRFSHAATAAILAFGILVLGPASASADGKGKRGGDLRLVATVSQEEYVDVGGLGPTLGDQLVFSEVLRSRGREVGMSGVVCTVTEVVAYETTTFHCVGTLSLRRGQITLQGLIEVQGEDDPGPWTVAITGGTGAYRGASGEARVRQVSLTRTVYKLRFDSDKKKKRGRHHN